MEIHSHINMPGYPFMKYGQISEAFVYFRNKESQVLCEVDNAIKLVKFNKVIEITRYNSVHVHK